MAMRTRKEIETDIRNYETRLFSYEAEPTCFCDDFTGLVHGVEHIGIIDNWRNAKHELKLYNRVESVSDGLGGLAYEVRCQA